MLTPRIMQHSMRRLAVHHPARASTVLSQLARPVAITSPTLSLQKRTSTTEQAPIPPSTAYSILEQQRLKRPVSPHLGIYKPQITWIPSILNRLTGSILSGGLYIFGAAYLVSPLFGWHLESATMAAAVAGWPLAVKFLLKMGVAWPFVFHSVNGVRHLMWDMGRGITNAQVARTGWAVVGVSVVGALGLALI
ncbi:succinate dehydrogenase cytochrome b560 subunit [Viridothelium virens]|uniref:Succinate dehydrogenase cytochrome b560 subunit n=1 Tax=Viridothelium virens TaxID=1048519 RepID=A0A6A6GXZ4_VIRVR|nr:succinate dehydrogenase cytochrome b560 subunit [Viridothelium virens]